MEAGPGRQLAAVRTEANLGLEPITFQLPFLLHVRAWPAAEYLGSRTEKGIDVMRERVQRDTRHLLGQLCYPFEFR